MRWFVGLTVLAVLLVAESALHSQQQATLPLPIVQSVAIEDSTALSITNRGSRTVFEVILNNVSSMLPALDVRSDGAGAAVRARGTLSGAAVEAIAAGSGSAASFRNENPANVAPAVSVSTASTGPALDVSTTGTGPAAVIRGDLRVEGALKVHGSDIVPIGAVLPFWGNPAMLDDSWILCDGRVINVAGSPLNGQRVPNLVEMFMRGANGQGQLGATGGTDTIPNHAHSYSASTNSVWFGLQSGNGNIAGAHPVSAAQGASWDASKQLLAKSPQDAPNPYNSHGHMNGIASIAGTTFPGGGGDNRPRFVSINFIMRVK